MRGPRRVVLLLARTAGGTLLAFAFAFFLLLGLMLHASAPAVRRIARDVAHEQTKDLFAGKLVFGEVQRLTLGRTAYAEIAEVEVLDPSGRRAILAHDVGANINLVQLLASIVIAGPVEVDIDETRVRSAEVVLATTTEHLLSIDAAFREPKRTTPPPPNTVAPLTTTTTPAPTPHVTLKRAHIGHAWAHGSLASSEFDGDADDVVARLTIEDDHLALAVEHAQVALRAPHAASARFPLEGGAHGSLEVELADGTVTKAALALDGAFGRVPVSAEWLVSGKHHAARLDAGPTTAIEDALGEALTIHGPVKLHARAEGTWPTLDVDSVVAIGGSNAHVTGDVSFRDERTFRFAIDAEHIDLRVFGSSMETDLSGKAELAGRFDRERLEAVLRTSQRGLEASADVTFNLHTSTIHGSAHLSATNVAHGGISAQKLKLNAVFDGDVDSPRASVSLEGRNLETSAFGGMPIRIDRATAHTSLVLEPMLQLREPRIELLLSGEHESLSATADSVTLDNEGVAVHALRVMGLGAPLTSELHVKESAWHMRAASHDLEVGRLAARLHLTALLKLPEDARASFDLELGSNEPNGHLDLSMWSPMGYGFGAVSLATHASVARGTLKGYGKLLVDHRGVVELTRAELTLPSRLDRRALAGLTGNADLRGTFDLAGISSLMTAKLARRVAGRGSFDLHAERTHLDVSPYMLATIQTHGLHVALGDSDSANAGDDQPLSGLDALAYVAWDGRSGDTEMAVTSWNAHGLVASANVKAILPIAPWLFGSLTLDRATLGAIRLSAVADVPMVSLTELPRALHRKAMHGRIRAHATVTGTAAAPHLSVSAHAEDVSANAGPSFNGALEARWNGEHAAFAVGFDEHPLPSRDSPPAHLRGQVIVTNLRSTELFSSASEPSSWRADAALEGEGLPLEIASWASSRLHGNLSGRFDVRGIHGEPSFDAQAHVDGFGVGRAHMARADLHARGIDQALVMDASMSDPSSHAKLALVSTGLRLNPTSVTWDADAPSRLEVTVDRGQLALLRPFVQRTLADLDGRVDGSMQVTFAHGARHIEGGLALSDGHAYVRALGEEVSALSAIAKIEPSGTFQLDDVHANVGEGEIHASVSGKLTGFRLEHAQILLSASKGGLPIASQGAKFADATGEARIKATIDGDVLSANIALSHASIVLPKSMPSLQPLAPDPTVAIGFRRPNGTLDTSRGRDSTRTPTADVLGMRLEFELGEDVRIEGRGLDVGLGGRAFVTSNNELKVTGRIELRGGSVLVHGRRFTIDRGTVTFAESGDPENPTLVTSAYWDAPNRTRVWLDYTGPLKGGRLTLRSEPELTPNEILSVLLFGQVDPNLATIGASPAQPTAAAGAGFLATDLNQALSELDPNLDLDTDTLGGHRLRAKVGRSFFERRLKISLGIAPGRVTYRDPDTTFLFLSWQLLPKWSLVATGGDAGTTVLDVLYLHRY